jgi:hypothetical protein
MSTATLRLIAFPDRKRPGAFIGYLETGGALIGSTRQPLVDGARELLARSFDPRTPLTMRIEGKAYDSFQPLPIGKWAGWTYEERDQGGLRCVRWRSPPSRMPPEPTLRGQKSGSEPSVAPEGRETENRFRGGPPHGWQPQPTALLGRVA